MLTITENRFRSLEIYWKAVGKIFLELRENENIQTS